MHVMYRNDQMRTISTSHLRHLARLAWVMGIKSEICAPPYIEYVWRGVNSRRGVDTHWDEM
jgi:hypothetical protein